MSQEIYDILKVKDDQGEWHVIPALKGDRGNGITSVEFNANGTITITDNDGTVTTYTGLKDAMDYIATVVSTDTAHALISEGFAVGAQGGTDVGSDSPYYHNNAKYFADQASESATAASESATNASGSATSASGSATAASGSAGYSEAFAKGTRAGVDVSSSDPAYHNNSKFYSEQSSLSATAAAASATAAETSAASADGAAAQAMIAPVEASTTASAAHKAGTYFRMSGTLYIATADIASGGTITVGTNCKAAVLGNDVSDLKSALGEEDNLINGVHNFINYDYNTPFEREADPTKTNSLQLGVIRNGAIVTLNNSGALSVSVRVKVSGDVATTNSTATIATWEGIPLVAGHKYNFSVIQISGTCTKDGEAATPRSAIYRQGESVTVGNYQILTDRVCRFFTAEENVNYSLCVFAETGLIFTNAKYAVTLEDVTDKPIYTFINDRIDELTGYVRYYNFGRDTISSAGVTVSRDHDEYLISGNATANTTIKINGSFNTGWGNPDALNPLYLIDGQNYIIEVASESGICSIIPSVSVYPNGTGSSIAKIKRYADKAVMTFTASDSDNGYGIFLFIAANQSYTDYRCRITLKVFTDEKLELNANEEVFSNKTIQNIWTQGYWTRAGEWSTSGSYYSRSISSYGWTLTDDVVSIDFAESSENINRHLYLFAWELHNTSQSYAGFITDVNGVPTLTSDTSANLMALEGYDLDEIRNAYPSYHFRVEVLSSGSVSPEYYENIIFTCRRLPLDVKTYFKEELADTVTKIKSKQDEPSLVFLLSTDIHYESVTGTTFDRMIDNISALGKQIRVDGIWCLGDMTDGNKAQDVTNYRLAHMFDKFRTLKTPLFFAAGNHDCNAYSGGSIYTTAQMYQHYYSSMLNNVELNFDALGTSWYYDYDNYKIRVISLDIANTESTSPHYRYPAGTIEWFSALLPQTPNGYTVILLEHLSSIAEQNWNNTVPNNAEGINIAISSWLEDTNHTLVQFCGHSHADYHFDTPYLTIVTNCQKYEGQNDYVVTQEMRDAGTDKGVVGAQHWARVAGTVTEDCWDAVVIRPSSRKIDTIRFGAGIDRSFTY